MPSSGQRARGRGGPGADTTQPGPNNSTQSGPQISDAGYDGPSDNRGRSPSNTGQSQAGRTASRARSSSRGPATGQPAQQPDPARDPPEREARVLSRNLDLGGNAYNMLQGTGYVSIFLSSSRFATQNALTTYARLCAFTCYWFLQDPPFQKFGLLCTSSSFYSVSALVFPIHMNKCSFGWLAFFDDFCLLSNFPMSFRGV